MKMEGEEVKEGEEMLLLKRIKRERERASGSTAKERISKMPPCAAGKRSSIYRGVTRHRWTGRYEAHLWDKDSWSETQNKKGKQVYLGAYDEEEAAARAYDLAALKYWGPGTNINFPVSDYSRDIEEMQKLSREDYLASLRRKSSGSTRGLSKYRLSKQHGVKWEASLGRTLGNKYFNAGSCSTSEEATGAYDRAQGEYGGYGIDLGSCIKWWQGNKLADPEPSSRRQTEEPTNSVSDDKPPENQTTKGEEPETSEWPGQAHCKATEPYQLPTLGVPLPRNDRQKSCSVTALSVLGKSSVFKHMLDKVSNSGEDIKKPQSAELDKGKGKLAMPVPEQLGNSSKDPGCVFGGYQPPHLNAMFPSIYQAESSQPLHHQANTSDNLSESLWTSFGQNTSGVALTNSVSIC